MSTKEFNNQIISLEKNLKRFAKSLTNDEDEAKDLVQETYLKALDNKSKFREDINLKGWIFTIMRNIYINKYRRTLIRNTNLDSTKDLYYLNRVQNDGIFDPSEFCNLQEINEKIDHLESKFRTPLKMYLTGYKYDEIAQKLDLNLGTVKSRLFFAKRNLRTLLN
ncbi:MAG: RNA polymerase sigma factor [Bacteroidota bacterium]